MVKPASHAQKLRIGYFTTQDLNHRTQPCTLNTIPVNHELEGAIRCGIVTRRGACSVRGAKVEEEAGLDVQNKEREQQHQNTRAQRTTASLHATLRCRSAARTHTTSTVRMVWGPRPPPLCTGAAASSSPSSRRAARPWAPACPSSARRWAGQRRRGRGRGGRAVSRVLLARMLGRGVWERGVGRMLHK
ncbi:hypothetical protein B0H10DRAFT_1950414 [Mycena sp. CBHHK59/15]|nr:hypothetical protein B0H10DRAFT_1950414 [Mycena sp. CBHHK59/15]